MDESSALNILRLHSALKSDKRITITLGLEFSAPVNGGAILAALPATMAQGQCVTSVVHPGQEAFLQLTLLLYLVVVTGTEFLERLLRQKAVDLKNDSQVNYWMNFHFNISS